LKSKREEKLEKIIELLLPLAAKKSGTAIVCGHCGIIFLPHNNDCPVHLAENALYLEDDNES
jgi:uncharacterized OB-fold protein